MVTSNKNNEKTKGNQPNSGRSPIRDAESETFASTSTNNGRSPITMDESETLASTSRKKRRNKMREKNLANKTKNNSSIVASSEEANGKLPTGNESQTSTSSSRKECHRKMREKKAASKNKNNFSISASSEGALLGGTAGSIGAGSSVAALSMKDRHQKVLDKNAVGVSTASNHGSSVTAPFAKERHTQRGAAGGASSIDESGPAGTPAKGNDYTLQGPHNEREDNIVLPGAERVPGFNQNEESRHGFGIVPGLNQQEASNRGFELYTEDENTHVEHKEPAAILMNAELVQDTSTEDLERQIQERNKKLAVATVVQMADDPSSNRRKRCLLSAGVLLLVVGIAVGVIVAILTVKDSGSKTNSGASNQGEPAVPQADSFPDLPVDFISIGQEIEGVNGNDWLGRPVTVSADGKIIAGGARNAGYVRAWSLQDDEWFPLGEILYSNETHPDDLFGYAVSLSGSGEVLAVGSSVGAYVRVFEMIAGSWFQLGNDLKGDESGIFGESVDLSSDGSILVVGMSSSESGIARVYRWDADAEL